MRRLLTELSVFRQARETILMRPGRQNSFLVSRSPAEAINWCQECKKTWKLPL